jgi:preprotein translocase subunit YajC
MDYVLIVFALMILALICVFAFALWSQHRVARKNIKSN